jgi:preprotein translocase subunit SecG
MTLLTIIHVVACIALIIIVLLQADKGEGLSGAFGGGGSYAVFGKRGATGFVAKVTTAAAVVFMLTSFGLTLLVAKDSGPTTPLGGAGAPIESQSGSN